MGLPSVQHMTKQHGCPKVPAPWQRGSGRLQEDRPVFSWGAAVWTRLLLWPAHELILFPIWLPKGLVMELKKSE